MYCVAGAGRGGRGVCREDVASANLRGGSEKGRPYQVDSAAVAASRINTRTHLHRGMQIRIPLRHNCQRFGKWHGRENIRNAK